MDDASSSQMTDNDAMLQEETHLPLDYDSIGYNMRYDITEAIGENTLPEHF